MMREAMKPQEAEFRDGVPFLAGGLWIDFLNTQPVVGGEILDLIADAPKLAHWCALADLPDGTSGTASTAQTLRTHLRTAFEAMRARTPIPRAAVSAVNDLLAHLHIRRQLVPSLDGYRLIEDLAEDSRTLETLIALDFAGFVEGYEPVRLKRCDNPKCSMVFYDRGKNNRRRWCSTAVCGNRDKVANYRARKAAKHLQGDPA